MHNQRLAAPSVVARRGEHVRPRSAADASARHRTPCRRDEPCRLAADVRQPGHTAGAVVGAAPPGNGQPLSTRTDSPPGAGGIAYRLPPGAAAREPALEPFAAVVCIVGDFRPFRDWRGARRRASVHAICSSVSCRAANRSPHVKSLPPSNGLPRAPGRTCRRGAACFIGCSGVRRGRLPCTSCGRRSRTRYRSDRSGRLIRNTQPCGVCTPRKRYVTSSLSHGTCHGTCKGLHRLLHLPVSSHDHQNGQLNHASIPSSCDVRVSCGGVRMFLGRYRTAGLRRTRTAGCPERRDGAG